MVHRIFQVIFSSHVLRVLFFLALIAFIVSLYHRYIQQDEPWFGEQAYWLVKEGNVKLKSMPGIFNWSDDMLIYHKLFVWLGAGLIFLFGWSIYLFKAFILLLFIGCAYLLVRFLQGIEASPVVLWLSLLLLVSTPEIIHRSFMFRPEVVIMLFGFVSFFCLHRFIHGKVWILAAIGGLFAGLAFLTHLNAMVFAICGFFYLMAFRAWHGAVIYAAVTGAVCVVYFWGLWDVQTFETYRFQLLNWPTHQSAFASKVDQSLWSTIVKNLSKLLNEHKRYFWDADVWGISALFLTALISRFRYLLKEHRSLTIYTLIMMVSLGVLTSGHSPRYLVYLMPFMVVTIAIVIHSLSEIAENKLLLKGLFVVVFTAYIGLSAVSFVKITQRNRAYVATHTALLSGISPKAKVLAPWEAIYNGILTHQIHSFKTYEYIEDQEKRKLSQLEFLALAAERFGMDYIILDEKRKNSKTFTWFKDWEITPNPYFTRHKQVEQYLILKRK